ncbi:major facilitator superfamily domain-containing protein [Parachaetomium inaequale]|uniref:Major facilitator superfamily domain-containing protein n=1 Tax=Parachaetomium inaequale TaxID=2588326 RepID=A0AAN6PJ57_9PEZI|nr:major facilitator superfamily domain-containing protein [Parachaetomium inaequale]
MEFCISISGSQHNSIGATAFVSLPAVDPLRRPGTVWGRSFRDRSRSRSRSTTPDPLTAQPFQQPKVLSSLPTHGPLISAKTSVDRHLRLGISLTVHSNTPRIMKQIFKPLSGHTDSAGRPAAYEFDRVPQPMCPRPLRPSTKPAQEELGDQNSQPAPAAAISPPLPSPSWQKPRRASASQPTRSLRYLVKQQLSLFPAMPFRKDGPITTAVVKVPDTDLSSDDETPTTPTTPTDQRKQDVHPDPPYHVFTTRKKWQLVYIVSLAGLFSPLSSNIYFPALGDIADGVAPSFWGPLSDTHGRRITFIGTFAVYLLANIALVFSHEYEMLVFRAIQAAGSAATISVGAGVIGDITTAKERGGFLGSFGGIRMLGQAIGPVVGGIVTEYFGFHAIFWLLFLLGSIALALLILFLPETLRRIAGNGTVPLHGLNRPEPPKITLGSILSPLRFLFEKDVFCTLLFGAVVYTIWSTVTSSTTALFQPRFHLTDLQVGLIFLPNGAGCIAGSCITGHLLDRDYRIVEAQYRASRGLPADAEINSKKTSDFPISRARLRSAWYQVVLFVLAVGGYGFAISSPLLAPAPASTARTGMAVPLVLQFIIAFTATGIFTQNSALMVDLYPGTSASATAVNNLIRCALGAAGVAAVQFVIDEIGAGVTFLVFAGLAVRLTPLLWLEWVYGDVWRRERMERLERQEQERERRRAEQAEAWKEGGIQ